MAANNLRIIYNNVASAASIISATNTNTNYPIANALVDNKGLVFRTTAATLPSAASTEITLTWATAQTVSAVVLPYTNLVPGISSVRTQVYSDEFFNTQVYDSGNVAVSAQGQQLFANTRGANYRYSFGGGSYFSKYFTKLTNCRGLKITITHNFTSAQDAYIEVGRLIVGDYWSPVHNTQFGLSVGVIDSSTSLRTQNGSLSTDAGTSHKTLSFDLSFLTAADREVLFNIIRSLGTKGSLYVSLFPEDVDQNKEYMHQIYGRLADLATISHPLYTVYASSISIQEV
jgi:hypothetical protein